MDGNTAVLTMLSVQIVRGSMLTGVNQGKPTMSWRGSEKYNKMPECNKILALQLRNCTAELFYISINRQ